MKKVLLFLVVLVFVGCSPKTDVTNTVVTNNGNNSVVDEIYGLNEVSYTQYAEYVDKAGKNNTSYSNANYSDADYSNTDYSNTDYSNSNYSYNSNSDDMIAMYYGNRSRLKWGKTELEKVVMHQFKDGHKDWFFPTFLYIEFRTFRRKE